MIAPEQRSNLHDAYDKMAAHIEELNDQRIREHSDIRKIHKRTGSRQCQCCREEWPCATMRAIGQEAAA